MLSFTRIALITLSLLMPLATQAADPDPLRRALAAGPGASDDHHRFALTYEADDTRITALIDTGKPEGERVSIQSSEIQDDDEYDRIVSEMERAAGQGYWCDEMIKGVGDDAKITSRTGTTVTYAFAPQPTGARNDGVLEHMQAEVTLDIASAQVVSYRMVAPNPFRQAIVAKIRKFDMKMGCSPAPGGRTYNSVFEMEVAGSAAFSKFEQAFNRTLELIE